MVNQMFKSALLCSIALILIGCSVSTKVTMTTGNKRPPINPEEVKIYDTAGKVPGEYEEIALLTSKGDYRHIDLAEIYSSMREEAAKIGANGIILGEFFEPSTRDKVLNNFFGTGADRKGKATAIYVYPLEKIKAITEKK